MRLKDRVNDVQGAFLPHWSPTKGQSVIVAGYGTNNTGNDGEFNFGYAVLDAVGKRFHVDLGDNHPTVGWYLENVYNEGEVAFQPGDSGGPDFVPVRTLINDQAYWIPEIVGVHSFASDVPFNQFLPGRGLHTASVQITPDVITMVKAAIGKRPTQVAQFDIDISDDGDGFPDGAGEWDARLYVNGLPFDFVNNAVHEGRVYRLGTYEMLGNSAVSFVFSGWERDGFLFNDDDPIPRFEASLTAPKLFYEQAETQWLPWVTGDVAYRIGVTFKVAWV